MKAILQPNKIPKVLVVSDFPETLSYNSHLLKPYKKGEIVKVEPFPKQKRNDKFDDNFLYDKGKMSDVKFRLRYVVIRRKDNFGEWSLIYTAPWSYFNLLSKTK